MSSLVFPNLPGINWPVIKTPTWATTVKKTVSGRELRSPRMSYPLWKFSLPLNLLRSTGSYTELQQLLAFFNELQGQYDTFFYVDTNDNAVTTQNFGTGDGATKSFQLVRTISGGSATFIEPIYWPQGSPSIYINGVLQSSGYTISQGLVTFTAAPASAAAITWTGNFYFNCRFTTDTADFENFMSGLFQLKKLEFISVKP